MKIRAILIPFLILLSFSGYAQWNPAIHIPINDALGQSQQAPIDGRSEFYITSPPKWRPYQNTAEVLSTLTTTASRFGNFIIIVDSGGTLQSNGTFLNGHNTYYMFADSTTNGGLVKLNLFGTNGCSGCLLAANNLGDLISAPTARGNLGLGGMAVLGTTAGGDLSGTYPNPTVSKFNGQLPAFYLNYSNLTNPPPLVSLTTTGTSGLATYNSSTGVLNIPNYSGSGGSCLNCNADTIGEIPLNFVSFCNGCVLTLDSTAGYAYWSPPTGGVASLPPNGGAGFRIYSPQIPAIRSLVCASGCTIDSTTNSGSLTFTVTTSGAGTVTSFSAGNLTGFATTSVGTATTTPALTFSYVNAPAYNIWGNNTASPAAPFYFSPNLSILNQWSGGTIAMLGATQIFTGSNTFNGATTIGNNVTFSANNTYTIGNISDVAAHVWARVFESDAGVSLASTTGNSASIDIGANPGITLLSTGQGQLNNYTTPTSFTGTPISLLSVDASGNIIQTSLIYPVSAVQGLHASVTGDSVEMGGFFFQPDTVNTLGYGFAITNLPEEATLGVGDSVLVEKAGSKYLTLVPSSAIGGGGAVSSVSDNGGGTLTISPTTEAVLAGINLANANTWSVGQTFSSGITLGGSITLTGSSGSLNIGDISHVLLHTYTRNVNSDGGLDLNAATGAAVNISINGVIKDATLSTGEKQWNGYTTSGSFTGTPISLVGPDASGIMVQPTGAQLAGFVTPGSVAQTVVTNPLTGVLNTLPRLNNFSVNYATTTNLNSNTYSGTGLGATLTAANPGALGTIDGIASAVGDTILVKNEGTQSHNGPYIVTVEGNGGTAYVLTRETYSSFGYNETAGASFYVEKGTANGVTTWYQTTTGPVAMGTTNLVYATENLGTGVSGTIGATQFGFGLSSGVLTSNGLNFYTAADSSANFKKVNVVGTPADSCGICVTISRIGVPAVGSGQGGSGGITLFPANSNVNPTIWLRDSRTGGLGVDTGLAIYNLNTTYAGGLSVVKSDEPGGLVIMSQNANLFFETHGVNGADFAAIAQGVSKHWSFGDNFGSDRGREMYIEGTVQLEDSLLVGGTSGYAFLSTATPLFNAYTTGRGWKIQVQNFTNQVGYNAIAIDSNANIYVPGGPYNVSGGLLYTGPSSGSSQVLQTASSTSSQVLIGGTTPAFGAVNLSSMVTNTLPVANGGTGDNTLTAYSLLAGGTTSTGALQQVSGLGTSGQVLTSNGAGLLPTWQAATGGGGSGSPGGANQDVQVKSGSNFLGLLGTFLQDTGYKGVRLNSGARAAFLQASTDSTGLWLQNTTAAATGAQQFSQVFTLEGQGWKTTATAASQSVKFHEVVEPVQGAANPTGLLVWGSNINNSATYMTDTLSYSSAGVMNIESAAPTYQAAITGSGTGSFTFNLSSTGAVLGGLTLTGSSGETRLSAGSGYLTMFTGSSEHARLIGPDLLIGTTTDNAAAILNVVSTTKGTIPEPSMTTTQQNAISSPTEGLRVYDNVLHTPAFYNGSAWVDYGATPTLQQVLTAGSTFTGANTLTQANNALTIAGGQVVLGNVSNTRTWNPNTALGGSIFSIQTGTLNDATTSASGTVGNVYVSGITSPTLSATNTGVVYTNAYTFWINASPVGGTNVTITNPYALGVTGNSLFQGNITANSINLTGSNDLTAQTTATTVTSYAVPGSTTFNTFRVGGYVTVTAVSLDVIQLQVTWTDETSTSRSQSFFVQGATTGIGATGAYAYSPIDIRVEKGTTITVATILTTGTGSITYDVGANITQLY